MTQPAWVIAIVALAGCSRPNPAYSETDTDPTDADSASSVQGGSMTEPSTSAFTVAASEGSSDTSVVCEVDDPGPFRIYLDGEPLDCDQGDLLTPNMAFFVEEQGDLFSFVGRPCGGCPCAVEPIGPVVEIGFDVELPPLITSDCVTIFRVLSQNDEGCRLDAYITWALPPGFLEGEDFLLNVVSNVVDPDIPELDVVLGEDPIRTCGDSCDPPPGDYPLEFFAESVPVEPGRLETVMDEFGDQFEIHNRASHIDQDCNEIARWFFVPLDAL